MVFIFVRGNQVILFPRFMRPAYFSSFIFLQHIALPIQDRKLLPYLRIVVIASTYCTHIQPILVPNCKLTSDNEINPQRN